MAVEAVQATNGPLGQGGATNPTLPRKNPRRAGALGLVGGGRSAETLSKLVSSGGDLLQIIDPKDRIERVKVGEPTYAVERAQDERSTLCHDGIGGVRHEVPPGHEHAGEGRAEPSNPDSRRACLRACREHR